MLEMEALRIAMREDAPALAAAMKAIVAKMHWPGPGRFAAAIARWTMPCIERSLRIPTSLSDRIPTRTSPCWCRPCATGCSSTFAYTSNPLKDHKALVRFVEKGQFDKA